MGRINDKLSFGDLGSMKGVVDSVKLLHSDGVEIKMHQTQKTWAGSCHGLLEDTTVM
jgi:hypothetical protein